MIRNISAFLFLIIISTSLFAQVTQEWVRIYNDPNNDVDEIRAAAIDDSGFVYVTGCIGYSNSLDFGTIKYSPGGAQLWLAVYNGQGNHFDSPTAMVVDKFGFVYVTGYGYAGENDIITVKYNSSGQLQWAKNYDGPAHGADGGYSIALDDSGNVYVGGSVLDSINLGDVCLIKYDNNGNLKWVRMFDGSHYTDFAKGISVDKDNFIYVAASVKNSNYDDDFCLLKYNRNGNLEWVRVYNDSANSYDVPKSIKVDCFGDIIISGSTAISTVRWDDFCTVKYSSSGVLKWVRKYNGPGSGEDFVDGLDIDSTGNVYITGKSAGEDSAFYDYCTIKYSRDGDLKWVERYNNVANGNDVATSIAVDREKNVYVTGYTTGNNYWGSSDICTIKYDSSGVQKWLTTFNNPLNHNDEAIALLADRNYNIYVAGFSEYYANSWQDYITIKYSQPIGIQPISSEVPDNFSLSQNYPNPFNPITRIKFDVPSNVKSQTANVKLVIYDVLGREISAHVNERLSPGTYEVQWDASNYPSGVYFYKLITEEFMQTRKMVLIK